MKKNYILMIAFLFLNLSMSLWAKADKHYKIVSVKPPVGLTVAPDSVVEFFNLGCPACFALEPKLETWLATKKNIHFSRIPLAFHKEWELYAKAYYVAQAFELEKELIPLLFNSIQTEKMLLQTPDEMIDFFVKKSKSLDKKLTADKIKAAFDSISLDAQLNYDKSLIKAYEISALPSFLVGGKYLVTPNEQCDFDCLLKTVDALLPPAKVASKKMNKK